jgi:signal transduction histidine kinase
MLERLRQSLAFRLAAIYSLVFALGTLALFGGLYWVLARSLERRERSVVEGLAQDFAQAYVQGGVSALRVRLDDTRSPDVRTAFVRLIGPAGDIVFGNLPPEWIDPRVQERVLAPTGWGNWQVQEVHSVRIPQNALRDFAVASVALPDGRLMQVARGTDSRAVLLAPLRRDFASVGLLALALSLAAGTLLGWRATRPLRQVAATARRIIEEDDLTARVPTPGGSGELAALVRQLNRLLDKNAGHVRALRETLDNVAHDLRTPLTRLRGTAELALQDGAGSGAGPAAGSSAGPLVELRGALADCVDESDRVLHLLEVLLDVSAAEAGLLPLRREPLDLREACRRAADLYHEVAEERGIRLILDLPEPAPMRADPARLASALNNLVDNALKYTPAGGEVVVAARREPNAALATVTDTGPGVPAAEREAIWRRLYRGDASRSERGLGLGLTLVRAMVLAHGGTAGVDEAPGGGARFTLRFPDPGVH